MGEAMVAVRMIRQHSRKEIATRGRGSERAAQEATDVAVKEIERLVRAKVDGIGATVVWARLRRLAVCVSAFVGLRMAARHTQPLPIAGGQC